MSTLLQSLQTYWPVHVLLLGYAGMLAYHAWAGNRETRDLADYYVGGRSMGGVALGLSFFATYSSTNSFVGFAGQSYEWGIAWLLLAPATVVMSIIAWLVVAPRLRRFTTRLGSLTVAEVAGTAKLVTEPRQLSRFYAIDHEDSVRAGAYTSTLAFAVVYSLLVPLGLYARNIFPEGVSETDRIVPMLLTQGDIFTPGVTAFLVVAMVAAAMSSLDSVLLVMASTAERDISAVLRGQRSEAEELRRTRLWVALFAFITAIIAMRPPGGIVGLTVLSGSIYAACFAPAVLLGLFWRGGNGGAVLGSFAAGLLVLLVWPLMPIAALIHQVFPAIAAALLVYVVIARAGGPVRSATLDRLFAD